MFDRLKRRASRAPVTGRADPLAEARRRVAEGDRAGAERAARTRLAAAPGDAAALHLLGSLLAQRGVLDEGRALLERAAAALPDSPQVQADLGNLHLLAGRCAEAAARYALALRAAPADPALLANLARARLACGHLAGAAAAVAGALETVPDDAPLWALAGSVRLAAGETASARAAFERAVALAPGLAEAHAGLGSALHEAGDLDAAIAAYRRALALQPGFVLALNNLGAALQEQGDTEGAREQLRRSVSLHPAAATRLRLALSLPPIMESREHIEETRAALDRALAAIASQAPRIDEPLRGVGLTSFYLAYHGLDDRPLQTKLARLYEQATPSLRFTAAHCRDPRPRRGRCRVGFVSTYLHDHTVGQTVLGLVEGLDRSRFEVTLAHFGKRGDAVEGALHRVADRVVELPMDLARARSRIADEALDVLFYPDIGMHPMTYFLAFARLAPLQCASYGHPDTTGLSSLDCFVSTALAEPPGAGTHYAERLVRLPAHVFWYRREPRPAPLRSRAELGLDAGAHLYLCPQSLFKLHPDFDAVAAGILDGDGAGRLLLLGGPSGADSRRLLARMERSLGARMDRVDLLPRLSHRDFVNLLALADVALDPLHFSGGRTTAELLAQGTPVVTWPGEFMRGRVTAAFYEAIGLRDFVVADRAQYVATALALGTDPAYREEGRRRILEAVDGLFENPASVRQLEDLFTAPPQG